MMTRNAAKEIAKKTAHAEACCQRLIEAVQNVDEDMWNLLPTATQERFRAAMPWSKFEDILDAFQDHVSNTTSEDDPARETPSSAPSLVSTLLCSKSVGPPSEDGTLEYDAVHPPSEAETLEYDAVDSVHF